MNFRDPVAVFLDLSAFYLVNRVLFDLQPEHRVLIPLLASFVPGLQPSRPGQAKTANARDMRDLWVMWTSSSSQNAGQQRFLDFAESDLGWTVRRFPPAESFLVEPVATLNLPPDSDQSGYLIRFDGSIGFAIGSVAKTHRIILVTDSFGLAEPLVRAARIRGGSPNILAFYGRGLDSRWQKLLRNPPAGLQFVDLDEHVQQLFKNEPVDSRKEGGRTALDDDFLM